MPMCVCGWVSDDDARFCRDCGRSLDTVGQHEVLLLDHEAVPSAPSTTVVRRGGWNGSGGNWPIALVALGVVVALAAWAIGRGSDAGSVADPIAEASTSTTTPVTGRESTPPSSQDGSPRSATLVGLEGTQLIISTTGRPALLDLASGQVTYHEGERLFPVAVYDRWLIVDGYEGGTAKIPLDDLGSEPELLIEVDDAVYTGVVSAPGQIERGQIWVGADRLTSAEELETTLYLIDLDTGAVIDEQPADAWDPLAFFDGGSGLAYGPGGGPAGGLDGGLVTAPAGGVYEETDDGYQLVTEGRLLAADDRRALVQTCDPKLVCTAAWLDRGSWEPLDLVLPDPADAAITFISGTDWVVATVYGYDGDESSVMTNIVTGQMVELSHANRARAGSVLPPAISPDGQWLAQITDDPRTLELRNLVSDERQVIELDEAADGRLFFIEV